MYPSARNIFLAALLLGAGGAAPDSGHAPAPPAGEKAPGDAAGSAVHVTVETIAVDRRGTWSVGSDVADIFPGRTGVMQKSATLVGRDATDPPREMVDLTARITPGVQGTAGCSLRIEAETKRVVAGAAAGSRAARPERTANTMTLNPDESRLMEVYSSSFTGARLALKVRCGSPGAADGSDPRFVGLALSVSRSDGDEDPKYLKSNLLRSVLGREASDLASFNVPLPEGKAGEKRYRKEQLETILSPILISGGQVQVEIRVRGEIATVSGASPDMTHPVDRSETAILSPGQPHAVEIDVRSSGPEEGWSRVRYRFEVSARF